VLGGAQHLSAVRFIERGGGVDSFGFLPQWAARRRHAKLASRSHAHAAQRGEKNINSQIGHRRAMDFFYFFISKDGRESANAFVCARCYVVRREIIFIAPARGSSLVFCIHIGNNPSAPITAAAKENNTACSFSCSICFK
jgi:hypothetical protein